MGEPFGLALSLRAAGTKVNASQTEDPSFGLPRQVQVLLEVLIVLMCTGAVTGTAEQQILYFNLSIVRVDHFKHLINP